jgi:hypothetical protein
MKTVVAYTLRGEDHTAYLVAKQGLFWLVRNDELGEHKIPAKAVDETWEEADEPTTDAERDELIADQETPEPDADEPAPELLPLSLAAQLDTGPTLPEPSDTITLAELCDTYGVIARIARRKLRAAAAAGKLDHDHRTGWVFPRTAIDDVMKIITTTQRG